MDQGLTKNNLARHLTVQLGSPVALAMDSEEGLGTVQMDLNSSHETKTLCLHAFSDLSHMPPAIFVCLLKECYLYGTCKATDKFCALQKQLVTILENSPQPGPATFVVQCLYVFSILGHPYTEGFSHLLISSLRRLQPVETIELDFLEAQGLATQLFLDATAGLVIHELNVLIKLLEAFQVGLPNIGKAIHGLELKDASLDVAQAYVESYIDKLIEKKLYSSAVILLEHFDIHLPDDSFLSRLMQENQLKPAEKLATLMGRSMLCKVVEKYIEMKMLKDACRVMKTNNLQQEFPHVYQIYKESSLKRLAEKACWDVAETRTKGDRKLVEYLAYLALEAGYSEKFEELCERYSLEGFLNDKEPGSSSSNSLQTHYLNTDALAVDRIVWVDQVEALISATSQIEGCKVIGVDCEWKPNYVKGSQPNKVSIIQIAADNVVFIIDLIKLSMDEPTVLNSCFKRILQSPSILKLGYSLQCDLKQLSHSYKELECFKHYEMLLDIQNMFKERKGGLSGLAKKILGSGLNKTRRNSNWEQRPLSQNQMEYAALDAAVLLRIFSHVGDHKRSLEGDKQSEKVEWKSSLVSHLDDKDKTHKPKKKPQSRNVVGSGSSVSEESS